jgi:hypothetical protein
MVGRKTYRCHHYNQWSFPDLYSRQAQLLDNAFRVALARSYYTITNDATLQANMVISLK